MNQLLRLPLLKYTHTHSEKNNIYDKKDKKKSSTNLPSQEKSTPTTTPMATVKEWELSTVVAKTSTPEAAGILDSLHFYLSAT